MMKQAGGDNMKIDIYKSKFFISMDFTHAEIMDTSFSKNSDSEKKILREGKKHSKEMIKLFDIIIDPFKKNGLDQTAENKKHISSLKKCKKEYEDMFNYTPNQMRKWTRKLLLLKKNIIEKFILEQHPIKKCTYRYINPMQIGFYEHFKIGLNHKEPQKKIKFNKDIHYGHQITVEFKNNNKANQLKDKKKATNLKNKFEKFYNKKFFIPYKFNLFNFEDKIVISNLN